MAIDTSQLADLRVEVERLLGEVSHSFIEGLGAPPTIPKHGCDFATDVDVYLERTLRTELMRRTGFRCSGEECGVSIGEDPGWAIDPIDGTSNYSTGNPQCATLVSLIDGDDVLVAATSIPISNVMLSATRASDHLYRNGEPYRERSAHALAMQQIGYGSIVSPEDARFNTEVRQRVLRALVERYPRLRITGSVGVDLAFAAVGTFGGALSFSPHVWDNAAGYLLNRVVGNTVTDLAGAPWKPGGVGLIVGNPTMHSTIRELLDEAELYCREKGSCSCR